MRQRPHHSSRVNSLITFPSASGPDGVGSLLSGVLHNDWCLEHNQPGYIIDLIGRVVRVSMETIGIVAGLPALKERK